MTRWQWWILAAGVIAAAFYMVGRAIGAEVSP